MIESDPTFSFSHPLIRAHVIIPGKPRRLIFETEELRKIWFMLVGRTEPNYVLHALPFVSPGLSRLFSVKKEEDN